MFYRLLLVVLVFSSTGLSQKLPFQHYTSDNGLVQNQVFDIYQDQYGFMWFASTGGISRYDGVSFENFTLEHGLPSLGVKCIAADKTGNLWFGTNNGIARYDYEKFTPYTVDSGFVEGTVWAALCDRQGVLWFGTREGGLVRYDGKSFKRFSNDTGLPNDGIYGLYEDRNGLLWIGTRSRGVYTYDGTTFKNIRLNPSGKESIIRSFAEDSEGRFWVFAYGGGLYLREHDRWTRFTVQDGLPENDVYRGCFTRSGRAYVGTVNEGFVIYDGSSFSKPIRAENGLIGNQVLCIMEDREGSLWFGCANGVSKLTSFRYRNWTEKEGLPSSRVYAIREDIRNNLWVGTDNGIAVFYPDEMRVYTEKNGLPSGQIWSYIPETDGSMWVGTVKGLYHFKNGSFTAVRSNSPVVDQNISQMMRDKAGNIWIGSTVGVTRFDGKTFRDYNVAGGLSNSYCYSIAQDCTGTMWFGTNHGLNRLESNDSFTVFYAGHGLRDDDINAMVTGPDGKLWIGTNSGLHSFDGKNFSFFGDSAGIPDAVLSLCFSNSNVLWVATKYATFAFDGQTTIDKISKDRGAAGTEVITNNSMFVDHRQKLWLGFFNGLTEYNPELQDRHAVAPLAWITGWKLRDEYSPLQFWHSMEPPALEYGQNTITFYFRGLSFKDERDVTFRYRLVGLDEDWSQPTRTADVRYTNLSPGDYEFNVLAVNRYGVVSATPAKFDFHINAPFWQQWWFLGLVSIVLAFGGWQSLKYRTARILRRNRELEQLVAERTASLRDYSGKLEESNRALEESNAQIRRSSEYKSKFLSNMSHELRTPLNAIIGFSEILLDRNHSPLTEEQRKSTAAIQSSGKNLLNLVNDLLDLSKIEAGRMELSTEPTDMGYLLTSVKEGLAPLFAGKSQAVTLQLDDDLPEIKGDREKLKQVFINLLGNANKFTPEGGSVKIEVRKSERNGSRVVRVTVADTGKGIPTAELESIFDEFRQSSMNKNRDGTGLGLTLCRKLVDLHNGVISARSDGKSGSTFIVELPVS